MLFNHTFRFAFIHIPRTGGTSLRTGLRDRNSGKALKWESSGYKHHTYQQSQSLVNFDIGGYTVFSLIRDPRERLQSLYYKKIKTMLSKLSMSSPARTRVPDHQRSAYTQELERIRSLGVNEWLRQNPPESLCDYTAGAPDHTRYYHTDSVHLLGQWLSEQYPDRLKFVVTRSNPTTHPHWSEDLTPETQQWILKTYQQDYQRFSF